MNLWVQGPSRQRYLGALQISIVSPIVPASSDPQSLKRDLRLQLRSRRRALPSRMQQRAARTMTALAMRQRWYRRAHTLAAYLANDAEIDPAPLLRAAYAAGKHILLPRLRRRKLEFVAYRPGMLLRRNRFKIPEPIGQAVALPRIDVICMPLVGFDRKGRRLGMGGGFYDRTLAKLVRKNRTSTSGPSLIGLAYACQEVAHLPHEQWDVRLQGIITEREWIRVQ